MTQAEKDVLKDRMLQVCAKAVQRAMEGEEGKRVAGNLLRKLANDVEANTLDQQVETTRLLYG